MDAGCPGAAQWAKEHRGLNIPINLRQSRPGHPKIEPEDFIGKYKMWWISRRPSQETLEAFLDDSLNDSQAEEMSEHCWVGKRGFVTACIALRWWWDIGPKDNDSVNDWIKHLEELYWVITAYRNW